MQSDPSENRPSAELPRPVTSTAGLPLLQRLTDELAQNRPGIQTTEFIVLLALYVVITILTALGKVPTNLSVIVGAFSAATYQWLRNNRKDSREESLLALIDTFTSSAPALLPARIAATTDGTNIPTAPTATSADANAAPNVPIEWRSLAHISPESSASSSSSSSTSGHASLALLCLLSFCAATFLAGCATLEKWQADPRVQFAEQEALKIGVAALQRYSNGGNFDSVWGISEGLYAFTDTISALSANKTNADANNALALQLAQTVQSYASTKDTKALAGQIAAIITKADPQTDAQRVAVVNGIANSLQSAAKVTTPADGKTVSP